MINKVCSLVNRWHYGPTLQKKKKSPGLSLPAVCMMLWSYLHIVTYFVHMILNNSNVVTDLGLDFLKLSDTTACNHRVYH